MAASHYLARPLIFRSIGGFESTVQSKTQEPAPRTGRGGRPPPLGEKGCTSLRLFLSWELRPQDKHAAQNPEEGRAQARREKAWSAGHPPAGVLHNLPGDAGQLFTMYPSRCRPGKGSSSHWRGNTSYWNLLPLPLCGAATSTVRFRALQAGKCAGSGAAARGGQECWGAAPQGQRTTEGWGKRNNRGRPCSPESQATSAWQQEILE